MPNPHQCGTWGLGFKTHLHAHTILAITCNCSHQKTIHIYKQKELAASTSHYGPQGIAQRFFIKVLLVESKHDNSTNESPRAKRHFASGSVNEKDGSSWAETDTSLGQGETTIARACSRYCTCEKNIRDSSRGAMAE